MVGSILHIVAERPIGQGLWFVTLMGMEMSDSLRAINRDHSKTALVRIEVFPHKTCCFQGV
jgi:hypothetical protein